MRLNNKLFCSAPAGVAGGGSVDMLGVPGANECMMLIAAVGLFLFAAYAIFEVWGKRPQSQETPVNSALAN